MIQTDFIFFNVESIHGFTSTFLNIQPATPYTFILLWKIKIQPLDILKIIIILLSNQGNKVAFIRVHEYGALARNSKFMQN